MRTARTCGLAASNCLLAQTHRDLSVGPKDARALQAGTGQDEETAQFMVVQVPDGVEEVTIETHHRPRGATQTIITRSAPTRRLTPGIPSRSIGPRGRADRTRSSAGDS